MAVQRGFSFPPRIGPKGGWLTSDLSAIDTTRIRESIQIILRTRFMDRVMENTFGSNLIESVFENMDLTLASILKFQVQKALEQWEKRIKVSNVSVMYDQDSSTTNIIIDYVILSLQVRDNVTVSLGKGGN
jgi:phage baseplate assembly protein W